MARRKRERKWLKVVIYLLFVVALAAVGVVIWRNSNPETSEETTAEATTPGGAGTVQEPEEEGYGGGEATEVEQKEETVQYEGADPNTAEGLTGVVTYAGVSGEYLMIRVNIDQYLNGGECRLNLMRGSEVVYEETTAIIDAASTSTCEGFNVPTGRLAGANYGIKVYLSSGGKSGTITGEANL